MEIGCLSKEDTRKLKALEAAAKLRLSRAEAKSVRSRSDYLKRIESNSTVSSSPDFEHTNKKQLYDLLQDCKQSAQQDQQDLQAIIDQQQSHLLALQQSELLAKTQLNTLQATVEQLQQSRARSKARHTEHLQNQHDLHQRAIQYEQNTRALQVQDHKKQFQQQEAAHAAALADEKKLYQTLEKQCSRHLKNISAHIQKKHAAAAKHTASLAAATVHMQTPEGRAAKERHGIIAGLTNHALRKHAPAMRVKEKPGPKVAEATPIPPTIGLRDTQVGNATSTSAYTPVIILKMAKMQTDGRVPTSRMHGCGVNAADMILAQAYPHNMPGTTTLRQARKITDNLYIRAIRGEMDWNLGDSSTHSSNTHSSNLNFTPHSFCTI